MDPRKFTTIAHGWRRFLGPIQADKADRLIGALGLVQEDRIVDIGCGKGEFLVRCCESSLCMGVGIDVNEAFLTEARLASACRGAEGQTEFRCSDAGKFLAKDSSFTVALCTGATHALGSFRKTLDAFASMLPVGGRILVADGYWKQQPSQEYLDFLGGVKEELFDHRGNREQLVEAGFLPTYVAESSLDEWDDYEGEYAAATEQWVREHEEDEDAPLILNRIRAWNDAYHTWGRDTLGLGWYVGVRIDPSS